MSDSLLKKLREYADSDMYPFHMPGHKRRDLTDFMHQNDPAKNGGPEDTHDPRQTSLPYGIDITEIEGFDNLHHAEGILRDAMDHAAGVYGADRTYFLVNGSTCGILAAICAATITGSSILIARNSHISAYNALILGGLDPVYILPHTLTESILFGAGGSADDPCTEIFGSVAPSDVDEALQKDTDHAIRAVFIVSPTYEGIASDVRQIAEISHRYGIPLIVDEAHGAHLPFAPDDGYFPESALYCGADIVIQSLHKTLPALTQTAVMHVKGNLVDTSRIEQFLRMFESSSPSYILMASIDECIRYMAGDGRAEMGRYEERLKDFYGEAASLKNIKVFGSPSGISAGQTFPGKTGEYRPGIFARDPSKIVIYTGISKLTGPELAGILRDDYHIETEMSAPGYVIAMTSLMDTDEGFGRLSRALTEIDHSLCCK